MTGSPPDGRVASNPRQPLLRIVIGLALAVGLLPFLFEFSGRNFLPSPEWVAQTTAFSIAFSLISAAACWLLMMFTADDGPPPADPLKRQLAGFGAFLASAFLGFHFVNQTIPLVGVLFGGQPTQIAYTVTRVGEGNRRRCANPITVSAGGEICGFPEDFVSAFTRGDTLLVSGRGTTQGIFLTTATMGAPQ